MGLASGLLQIGRKLKKWQWHHNFRTWCHREIFLFFFSSLVTGPNFMSISSLVLELWQFTFVRDWPEICKSEIPPSEFFLISGDWSKLATPNLARSSSIKCYWILKNSKVTTFTVSELLRENQHEGEVKLPPLLPTHTHIHKHTHTYTQIRVNTKRLEAEKNNDKDEKVSHKLINNAIHGKTMENVRKRIDVKLVKKKKDYLKCTSKPSYMSQKIFHNNLVTIRNSKRAA